MNFFSDGWQQAEMQAFTHRTLDYTDTNIEDLPPGLVKEYSMIPFLLAHATINALVTRRIKLTRSKKIDQIGL